MTVLIDILDECMCAAHEHRLHSTEGKWIGIPRSWVPELERQCGRSLVIDGHDRIVHAIALGGEEYTTIAGLRVMATLEDGIRVW